MLPAPVPPLQHPRARGPRRRSRRAHRLPLHRVRGAASGQPLVSVAFVRQPPPVKRLPLDRPLPVSERLRSPDKRASRSRFGGQTARSSSRTARSSRWRSPMSAVSGSGCRNTRNCEPAAPPRPSSTAELSRRGRQQGAPSVALREARPVQEDVRGRSRSGSLNGQPGDSRTASRSRRAWCSTSRPSSRRCRRRSHISASTVLTGPSSCSTSGPDKRQPSQDQARDGTTSAR